MYIQKQQLLQVLVAAVLQWCITHTHTHSFNAGEQRKGITRTTLCTVKKQMKKTRKPPSNSISLHATQHA